MKKVVHAILAEMRWGYLYEGRARFLGSVVQICGRDNRQSRVGDDLLRVVNICPLQPHNQRDLKFNALAGVDDAVGNGGAVDNAAKHVDKDGLHALVLRDDPEGFPHLEREHRNCYVLS